MNSVSAVLSPIHFNDVTSRGDLFLDDPWFPWGMVGLGSGFDLYRLANHQFWERFCTAIVEFLGLLFLVGDLIWYGCLEFWHIQFVVA